MSDLDSLEHLLDRRGVLQRGGKSVRHNGCINAVVSTLDIFRNVYLGVDAELDCLGPLVVVLTPPPLDVSLQQNPPSVAK